MVPRKPTRPGALFDSRTEVWRQVGLANLIERSADGAQLAAEVLRAVRSGGDGNQT